jgi:protein-S-isoprenylcysteine O-methyltransferase Ste14
VAVAVPWFAGLVAEAMTSPWLDPSRDTRSALRLTGWLLVLAFAVWNGWCLALFARHRTGLLPGQSTSTLLTAGPYRISRNPLYVGLLVLYVGAALTVVSAGALALVPLAWAGLHWGAVLPEERYLLAVSGPEYAAYRRRVRRWL